MDTSKVLRGIELRYVLTLIVTDSGPLTVPDLVDELGRQGFSVNGRPSKTVSDSLRWEVALGRVERRDRNLYGPGFIPRSTDQRIRTRVAALREDPSPSDDWDAIFGEVRGA